MPSSFLLDDSARCRGSACERCSGSAALIEFSGFPRRGVPPGPLAVLLPVQGDPDAVARWLASAWAAAAAPEDLASLLLNSAPAGWCPPGPENEARHPPIHRYRLRLGRQGGVTLACWRRYGGALGWQRRCGPMPLRRFLQHRLRLGAAAATAPD